MLQCIVLRWQLYYTRHLNIKPKMFDFEARVLIDWIARVFTIQSIRTRASKSNIFGFMLRWHTFIAASIIELPL